MTRARGRKTEEKKVEPKVEEKPPEVVEEENEADVAEEEEHHDENGDGEGGNENGGDDGNEGGDGGHDGGEGDADDPKLTDEERAALKEANKALAEQDTDKMTIDEILKMQLKLSDGSEQFIFSRGPKYEEDKWPVNCHLCRLGNLFTEEHIKHHLKGRGHSNGLKFRLSRPKFYNEPFITSVPKEYEKEKPIKIYPGEFIEEVNEEYQDRILTSDDFPVKPPKDEALIKTLSKEKMHEYNSRLPLIGLCYIYKMMGYRGITYYCTLCDTNLRGEAFRHIVSSDHQFKYIKRHFSSLYEKIHKRLMELSRDIDILFCERNIFRKLYRKIENIKGQKKITMCDDDDFFKNKKRYLLKTRFDEHYNESTIVFTDQEIDVLIRKCKNHMEFIRPDLISLENPRLGYRLTFEDEKAGAQVSDKDDDRGVDRRSRRDRDDDFGRGGGRGGGGADYYDYYQLMEREVEDLNHLYRNYEGHPRTHPKYEIEYQRYKNGQKRGDKREFDVPFGTYWKRRLHILYDTELEKRKQRVMRELGLRRTPSPPRRDNYGDMQGYGGSAGGYGNDNFANQAGLRDLVNMMSQQMSGNNNLGGGNYGMSGSAEPAPPPEIQQNEPLGVISVLRLFTAVESQLGSLGPQAVQLLSRAVMVEKNGQNPNDLMMEKDFYIFFATAREKLKGQYIANTIPTNLMSASKKIIQDSTTLMEMFEDYCKRTGKSLPDLIADSHNMGGGGGGGGGGGSGGGGGGGSGGGNQGTMWKGDQGGAGGGNRFDNDFYGGNNASGNNDNRGGGGFGGNQNYGYSSAGYSSNNNGFGGGNPGYNTNQSSVGSRWN